ncbi:hypothetical protein LQ772_06575 [Frateuria edaphi]|uniref:hypothetical protein n=1 Tax=Frateuria edaphi TaxID=2898793 RepID=UPI001E33C0A7|nr:hypothetical protein [Frateuria edaphi]UGB46950.1 hypothetical protein LQ772_06575 [Frateuria edaphi]
MLELPILFSAPMVRVILAGRKTQTRRVVKPQPNLQTTEWSAAAGDTGRWIGLGPSEATGGTRQTWGWAPCPYGAPGDRLWVRETWGYRVGCGVNPTTEAVIEYRADSSKATLPVPAGESGLPRQRPNMTDEELLAWWESWRPSIHMPRWASRITLEVTGVRVERLQDISGDDACAEGIDLDFHDSWHPSNQRGAFKKLWESINGAGSWDANPWVWVVDFRRIEQEAKAA